jgi:hypothetical protein
VKLRRQAYRLQKLNRRSRHGCLYSKQALHAFGLAASKLRVWQVMPAILMPDHPHVVVAPTKERETKLGNFSAALKRWIRQELKPSWK